MKRLKPGKALGCLLCILLTCALILAYPALSARLSAAAPSAPPGVNAARRQLLTVWLAGDCLNAAPWVRAQAAEDGQSGKPFYKHGKLLVRLHGTESAGQQYTPIRAEGNQG